MAGLIWLHWYFERLWDFDENTDFFEMIQSFALKRGDFQTIFCVHVFTRRAVVGSVSYIIGVHIWWRARPAKPNMEPPEIEQQD